MAKRFRPRRTPTFIALFMLAILIGLGAWQVRRLAWKTALVQTVQERLAARPAPLPEKIERPESLEYRRVKMAGRFLHEHVFLLKPRTMNGRAGAHMVTPFKRASGGMVFVNRGWISDEFLEKADRPQGMVAVEGIVRLPARPAFAPANDPLKNQWYWLDIAGMAAAARLPAPLPVVVDAVEGAPGVVPVGGQTRLDIPNDHGQYAAFWFTMALALCAVWALSSRAEDPSCPPTSAPGDKARP